MFSLFTITLEEGDGERIIKENNHMEEQDSSVGLELSEESNLSKKVDKLPAYMWILSTIGKFFKAIFAFVFSFIIDVFKSLFNFFKVVGLGIYKGILGIGKIFKDLYHKFVFNDIWGRLSFLFFGVSNIANRRYVNGLLMLVFEIAYLFLFFFSGVGSIRLLGSLGDVKKSYEGNCTFDPDLGDELCEHVPASNSVLILVYAILWILSIFLFFVIWKKSIDSGYKNYRIAHFEDFVRRADTSKPYSDQIDEDITSSEFYSVSNKELKYRYLPVLKAMEELADKDTSLSEKERIIDKRYYKYVYIRTIEYRKEFHKKRLALLSKVNKIDAKINKIEGKYYFNDKIASLEKEVNVLVASYNQTSSDLDLMYDDLLKKGIQPKKDDAYNALSKKNHSLRDAKIRKESILVSLKQHKQKLIDKQNQKKLILTSKLDDLSKNDISFSTLDSVENHSQYGKFNVYYTKKAAFEKDILFYSHYQEIKDIYNSGLVDYASANEENKKKRETRKAEYEARLDEINKQYEGIYARRNAIIELRNKENEEFKSKIASCSKEEKADLLFQHNDMLKTLKGKILSLPTVKEIKVGKKEDVKNATKAYNRDYKGYVVDYSPKAYARAIATDELVVKYGLEYALASKYVRVIEKSLSNEEVAKRIEEQKANLEQYVNDNPNAYDGKPLTLKQQVSSLLNENFHTALLALPILGVLLFTLMPLILSILVAFTNFDKNHVFPASTFSWAGWLNFQDIFNPGEASAYQGLGKALQSTFVWTFVWAIVATFANYFLGIIFALMINKQGVKFKKFWRFVFMLSIAVPQFISLIALSVLLKDTGAFGKWWYQTFGYTLRFTNDADIQGLRTKLIIILVNIWVGIPYTILETTGILMNIPNDLYESSRVDGANPFTQFIKITMPYIFFVTGPRLIQTFIGNVNNFGVIYFLSGGNPANNVIAGGQLGYTDLLVTYLYKLVTSPNNANYGLASAIGIIVFVICSFVSIIMYNRTSSSSREDQFQ